MKRKLMHLKLNRGFTLAEMIVSTGVTSVLFSLLAIGLVTLPRSYKASEYYSTALGAQTRALDYIVRDTRGALSAQVSADQNTLTLTLPDYYSTYDAQGNPTGAPVAPNLTTVLTTYADPTKPLTVTYTVSGKRLLRQISIPRTGTNSQSVIATDVDNFDFTFGTVDSTITASLTFSPRFRGITSQTDQATNRSATIYMRNHQ